MSMYMNDSMGSVWRRWDLHVHTPASPNFTGSYDDVVQQINNADCEVIGINDYCTIAGYKRLAEEGQVQKPLVPVVEFRSHTSLQSRHSNGRNVHLNFHVIFNPDTGISRIETFINSIDCKNANGNDILIGSIGDQDLNLITVDYFALIEKMEKNNDLKNNYLIWLPYDEYGGVDEIDPEASNFKPSLINKAHILGSSRQKQIDFFLWKDEKYLQEQYAGWFGSPKPCIKGSDSHNASYPIGKLQDENSQPIEKYCWIKADPTFEGLRQIVYEPGRVVIQEKHPFIPPYRIEHVVFDFPSGTQIREDPFCLQGKHELHFSPYLTCIIGGRGTGKSTVLNLIAEKLDPDSTRFFDENRLSIPQNKTLHDCVAVDNDDDEKFIEFLSQNEIEAFALDYRKFTQAIYYRIEKRDEKGELVAAQGELDSQLSTTNVQIQAIIALQKEQKSLAEKKKEYQTNKKLVASLESEEYKKLTTDLGTIDKQLRAIRKSRTGYNSLLSAIKQLIDEKDAQKKENPNAYDAAYIRIIDSLKKVQEQEESADFSEIDKEEDELKKKYGEAENKMKAYLEAQDISEENLNDISAAQKNINELEGEIEGLGEEIASLKASIAEFDNEALQKAKEKYEQVIQSKIKPVSETLESLEHQVKPISLNYEFDESGARELLLGRFAEAFGKHRVDHLENYLFAQPPLKVSTQKKFLDTIRGKDNQMNKTQEFLTDLFQDEQNFEIYKLLIQRTYSDLTNLKVIRVLYDGKPLDHSSFGQRCTAATVILLLLGNTPIIIDEPEAHLDSSLIADYLVKVVKEKKTNRQIIFATHNANFVVNGDAELIHVLETEDGTTKIESTTIENLDYRDKLLSLEGGRVAFRQRGKKYKEYSL